MASSKSRQGPNQARPPSIPAPVSAFSLPEGFTTDKLPAGETDQLLSLIGHLHQLIDQLKTERGFLETVLQQMPAGVIIADAPSGRLRMGNEQVEKIWKTPFIPSRSVEEYAAWQGFHPDGRPYLPEEWPVARAIARGEIIVGEQIKIRRGDGRFAVISCNAGPIRDPKGNIVAGVVAFTDITQQQQAAEELQRQAQIIDQVHDSIIRTDLEGFITGWNAGAERMFGYSAREALRKPLSFVYPEEEQRFLQEQILQPLLRTGSQAADVRLCNSAGQIFYGHVSLSVLRDRKGAPLELIAYTLDITDRKHAEEAVQEKDARLHLLEKAGSVGYWELNLATRDLQWTDETFRQMGRDPKTFRPTYKAFLEGVHPQDRQWVNDAVEAAIKQKTEYDIEFRCVWPDGKVRWIATRGRAFYASGKPVRMFGVCIDITERKRRSQIRVRKLIAKPADAEAAS
jgi:PAS domain S-box-containing protein